MSDDVIIVLVDSDLEDLIPGFLGRRTEDVGKLRNAAGREDFDAARVIGHSLKGTGGGYGFHGLTEIGARIEDAAKAADGTALDGQIAALEDYLARVQVRLKPQ